MKLDLIFKSWFDFFDEFLFNTKYFKKLIKYISNQYILNDVYPAKKDIFKPFKLTNYNDLRVVMLGSEPNSDGTSNGLAFGIKDEAGEVKSPSLLGFQKSIEDSLKNGLYFMDFTLENWAKQGILLLNSSLTTIKGNKGIHSIYWKLFVKYMLIFLSRDKTGIIYVLVGNQAQSFEKYINDGSNFVLKYKHPDEVKDDWNETMFQDINEIIKEQNGESFCINW